MYSEDLEDVDWEMVNKFQTVENQIQFNLMIDHCGYFPISIPAKSKKNAWLTLGDIYKWFKFSIIEGIYFATGLTKDEYFEKFEDFNMVSELELSLELDDEDPEYKKYVNCTNFAHRVAGELGRDIFELSGGLTGYQSTEAVVTFTSTNRILTIFSSKFTSLERKGTGQFISAIEFSSPSFHLRSIHPIYTNGFRLRHMTDTAKLAAEVMQVSRIFNASPFR